MKKLNLCVIALFMLSFCSVTGQETIIEDVQLDSVVWNKINDYLVELNKKPIKHFEDGMMREFSRRLTRINSGREYISHSDSVGWVCSYEFYPVKLNVFICIISFIVFSILGLLHHDHSQV